MEGMRHKLSLPGLGMSKCTDRDPSGAAHAPRQGPGCSGAGWWEVAAVCRETRHCRRELRGVREVQDETRRASTQVM